MNIQEARTFVARFVQGKYSQEEHQAFLDWVGESSMDQVKAVAEEYESTYTHWSTTGKPSAQWIDQLEQRLDKLETQPTVIPLRRSIARRISWAAAILVLVGTGAYFLFFNNKPAQPAEQSVTGVDKNEKKVLPGGNRAVLTLADGSNIILNEAENGVITQQGNTTVKKLDNKQLVYQPNANGQQPALLYNTVYTPRGGQYQLTLPDQTKIWLNAESSIRFPVAFTGKERRVEITGEVYFEVTRNPSMPFKAVIGTDLTTGGVGRGRGEVEVVGTHFNIMAYENVPAIQTTLLKGAVKVAKGAAVRRLKPGQQARIANDLSNNENIKVLTIPDAGDLVSWKEGYFNGPEISTIMQQIARWYDVEIVYEGKVPALQYDGKLPRDVKIESLLKMLDVNGIHTRLDEENRKLFVKQ